MGSQHPWAVQNLEEFLYYCCPECNERNQSEELFFIHALESHPHSKEYILPFKVKSEENETYYNEYDVKVETSEYDLEGLSHMPVDESVDRLDETKQEISHDEDWTADYEEHEREEQSEHENDDSDDFSDSNPKPPKKKIKRSKCDVA